MPRDDDRDRPKKTFSELDKQRRERAKGRDERDAPGHKKLESSQAYRAYKSQLDKVFSGGGLPDALKEKLEESGVGAEAKLRKEKAAAIKEATAPKAIREALAAYREACGGFPRDEEALGQVLTLDDGALVAEALRTLLDLHGNGGLKRASSLKGRVKTAQMTVDDSDVVALAKDLLAKL